MKLMKRWSVPRVLVTDKLRSYGVAVRYLCPSVDHRRVSDHSFPQGLEQPIKGVASAHTTERKNMGRFKYPRQAQRFLSTHDQTASIFPPKRHRLSAAPYRQSWADAFSLWNNYAAEMAT
jgi:putative transposase